MTSTNNSLINPPTSVLTQSSVSGDDGKPRQTAPLKAKMGVGGRLVAERSTDGVGRRVQKDPRLASASVSRGQALVKEVALKQDAIPMPGPVPVPSQVGDVDKAVSSLSQSVAQLPEKTQALQALDALLALAGYVPEHNDVAVGWNTIVAETEHLDSEHAQIMIKGMANAQLLNNAAFLLKMLKLNTLQTQLSEQQFLSGLRFCSDVLGFPKAYSKSLANSLTDKFIGYNDVHDENINDPSRASLKKWLNPQTPTSGPCSILGYDIAGQNFMHQLHQAITHPERQPTSLLQSEHADELPDTKVLDYLHLPQQPLSEAVRQTLQTHVTFYDGKLISSKQELQCLEQAAQNPDLSAQDQQTLRRLVASLKKINQNSYEKRANYFGISFAGVEQHVLLQQQIDKLQCLGSKPRGDEAEKVRCEMNALIVERDELHNNLASVFKDACHSNSGLSTVHYQFDRRRQTLFNNFESFERCQELFARRYRKVLQQHDGNPQHPEVKKFIHYRDDVLRLKRHALDIEAGTVQAFGELLKPHLHLRENKFSHSGYQVDAEASIDQMPHEFQDLARAQMHHSSAYALQPKRIKNLFEQLQTACNGDVSKVSNWVEENHPGQADLKSLAECAFDLHTLADKRKLYAEQKARDCEQTSKTLPTDDPERAGLVEDAEMYRTQAIGQGNQKTFHQELEKTLNTLAKQRRVQDHAADPPPGLSPEQAQAELQEAKQQHVEKFDNPEHYSNVLRARALGTAAGIDANFNTRYVKRNGSYEGLSLDSKMDLLSNFERNFESASEQTLQAYQPIANSAARTARQNLQQLVQQANQAVTQLSRQLPGLLDGLRLR